jgi:hypothetical protein
MSAKDFMGSGSLAASPYAEQEDADPRVGLVNLADVMLVFACGLMLALVTYWNLDVSKMTEVVQADEMAEVEGIEDLADQMGAGGSNFTELGMVYQDPMTGKMYMLRDEAPEGESDTGDSTKTSEQTNGQSN